MKGALDLGLRPDVLVVLTSQWRGQATGFAGDPNARTPCLDRLAEQGTWFPQAVTPHPFGVFARAAFLTGRRCPANGIRDYYDPLPARARTLAHAFSEQGYETAFFGKWQLFERDPSAPVVGEEHARVVVPSDRRGGFDFWEGFESGFLLNDPLLHGTVLPEPTRFEGYQAEVLVERFRAFCERRRARAGRSPLFAALSLDCPHPPYLAAANGFEPLEEQSIRLLEGTSADSEARATALRELSGYYAHIAATDRAVGRLVEQLQSSGDWGRSLFAFSSAHGDMHGVDGLFRKGWPHEESVRVPLVLAGGAFEGKSLGRNDLLISLLDLGPTLLGLALGLGPVALARYGFHGLDLSGALMGLGTGPSSQSISMPSVPPFAKQCPYVWTANRTRERTEVSVEEGKSFTLRHPVEKKFEPVAKR